MNACDGVSPISLFRDMWGLMLLYQSINLLTSSRFDSVLNGLSTCGFESVILTVVSKK